MARTPKNRRRLDPAEARAAALKGGVRALKVLGVLCLFALITVAATLGTRALRTWLFTSPTFAIDTIAITGLTHAAESEVLNLSRLRIGENIFEIDLEETAIAIREHPWVEDARVERSLPRGVEIEVVEHVPVRRAADHVARGAQSLPRRCAASGGGR